MIRIAIAAGSEKRRRILKREIEKKADLEVVACTALTEAFLHQLSPTHADVLLVDLVTDDEPSPELFQRLLATKGVPIIFNDNDSEQSPITATWVEKLIDKMASLVSDNRPQNAPLDSDGLDDDFDSFTASTGPTIKPKKPKAVDNPEPGLAIDFEEELGIPTLSELGSEGAERKQVVDAETPDDSPVQTPPDKHEPTPTPVRFKPLVSEPVTEAQPKQAEQVHSSAPARAHTVSSSEEIQSLYPGADETAINSSGPDLWVLGASIGGPQAVKRFLGALPEKFEMSFLLVQHIGVNFVDLLADQLERSTPFSVKRAEEGDKHQSQQVLVAPADLYLSFHLSGDIHLKHRDKPTIYTPCIDEVLEEVAEHYPGANAVIFSGMGDDGAKGIHAIAKAGGIIWAQDAESCIISSMPDCARNQKLVSYSGTPEQLAHQLISAVKKSDYDMQQGVS